MASFQAKIRGETLRKRENKYYRSVSFRSYTTRNRKFQKNSENYKIPLWLHLKPKQVRKGLEREKIKLSFRSVPTRHVIENSKKTAKKFRILKNTVMASF